MPRPRRALAKRWVSASSSRVGDVALLPLLAAPVVGDALAAAGLDVAVEAVGGGVQLAVGEPLVEGRVRTRRAPGSAPRSSRAARAPGAATRPRGRPLPPRTPPGRQAAPPRGSQRAAQTARPRAAPQLRSSAVTSRPHALLPGRYADANVPLDPQDRPNALPADHPRGPRLRLLPGRRRGGWASPRWSTRSGTSIPTCS